jgi:hypothetical protein
VAVVIPIGALLSQASRWWADWAAVYAWLYIDNWTWTYLASRGARADLLDTSVSFLILCATLFAWSWTSGFVLGALSRSSSWAVGALFCLMVLGATLGHTPPGRSSPFNNPVFALPFYRVVFPLLLRTALVLLPAWGGMRRGLNHAAPPLPFTIVLALTIGVLTAWSAKSLETAVISRMAPGPSGTRTRRRLGNPR